MSFRLKEQSTAQTGRPLQKGELNDLKDPLGSSCKFINEEGPRFSFADQELSHPEPGCSVRDVGPEVGHKGHRKMWERHKLGRRWMKSKISFLVLLGLLFVILMGCGGGGSTSGSGTTILTIVGTWNRASFTGTGANLPEQLIFNMNGSGSFSGTASGAATITWTYQGTQLTLNPQGRAAIVLVGPLVGTVVSPITLTDTNGGTATYNR
jgi:hypothetical protein